ncbi:MAG: hypothetical protein JWN95_3818 [Frankiales bacterium]|nr:hypothetical protein [Frankiales bacterium]
MKVRIGLGVSVSTPESLTPVLDGMASYGFDSIWLPELLTGDAFDPMIALTWAAAKYPKLKLGTTMLLPGRNVVRLAKQLATLDSLSSGRLLVTFVPGINRGPEAAAIGLPLAQRRAAIEEAMPVLRALLSGETVSHDGQVASFTDVRLSPLPVQQPLEFWLGGNAPRSLELCGRLGDGWLPSMLTPDEAAAGRVRIQSAAADAGRAVDVEHFGVSIGYSREPLSQQLHDRIAERAGKHEVAELVPVGLPALRQRLQQFIDVGFSKFVVRPVAAPTSWPAELAPLADAVLDLQT